MGVLKKKKDGSVKEKKLLHSYSNVVSSQTQIKENFANFILKPTAINTCYIVIKCTCIGLHKRIIELLW